MYDREKVIEDVKQAIKILGNVDEPTFWLDFVRVAVERALDLLKAQESVEPRKILPCITRPVGGYVCGHCGIRFLEKDDYYCSNCGRKVKWDDACRR